MCSVKRLPKIEITKDFTEGNIHMFGIDFTLTRVDGDLFLLSAKKDDIVRETQFFDIENLGISSSVLINEFGDYQKIVVTGSVEFINNPHGGYEPFNPIDI
jgi:hypothetical protein